MIKEHNQTCFEGLSMNNFEHIQMIMNLLNESEDELKVLRDNVDLPEKEVINKTIPFYTTIRDKMWNEEVNRTEKN